MQTPPDWLSIANKHTQTNIKSKVLNDILAGKKMINNVTQTDEDIYGMINF
jgi:histidine ammonia-lyase